MPRCRLCVVESHRDKIGQLLLVGVEGETFSRGEQLLCEEYGFGGFVLFQRNFQAAEQIVALCRNLWDSAEVIPPFIAIDHEGGRVHRLPAPFTHFPAATVIGRTNSAELAHQMGRAAAEELALIGVNLNFAPVLDVAGNSENSVIGSRAFAADPKAVITTAWSWAQGLRQRGIIPCGKHFPGHGAAEKDSHLELPTIAKSARELTINELAPFAYACRNRIEALMTAHVVYPAFDAQRPATLSEKIITGLLRHQMGYGGVVFSDDMDMRAISERYRAEEAAHESLRAGVDVLLFCHDLSRAAEVCEFLCAQSEQDAALRQRIEESYRRVTDLKRRYLKAFTGAHEGEIVERLARLEHSRLVAELQPELRS
jgi:beta-N-acetylhexosaminidase